MLPAGGRQHFGCIIPQTVTHSLALLKMGKIIARNMLQNNCPKHVELIWIINTPLLLHLVGCLYYLYQWCTVKQISDNEIYLLIKYIKSALWRVAKQLSYIEDARCLKVKFQVHNVIEQYKKNGIDCVEKVYVIQIKTILYQYVGNKKLCWGKFKFRLWGSDI